MQFEVEIIYARKAIQRRRLIERCPLNWVLIRFKCNNQNCHSDESRNLATLISPQKTLDSDFRRNDDIIKLKELC